jgi:hypothetical protein
MTKIPFSYEVEVVTFSEKVSMIAFDQSTFETDVDAGSTRK